jgi:hypothetical protein
MKFITSIFKRFVKDEKKVLGRWNIEVCETKMNNKIDLANEDHCGPCGEYQMEKAINSVEVCSLDFHRIPSAPKGNYVASRPEYSTYNNYTMEKISK